MPNFLRVIFLLCAQNVTFQLIGPLSDGVDAFASPSSLQSRNAATSPHYCLLWRKSRIRNSNPSATACIFRATSLYSTKHDRDSKSRNSISNSSSSSSINSYCENDNISASSSEATSTTTTTTTIIAIMIEEWRTYLRLQIVLIPCWAT
mmetsp:Transcript_5072/g.10111  ORF Transcript_5072/g.10111 Transcript_5072/m.10111 type:complete len:149 (+) Transcript_5072:198-644(+)